MNMLPPKQEQILKFIRDYIESNTESPTIEEICKRFDLRSAATVHQHLGSLEKAGLITRVPNVARGVRLIEQHRGDKGGQDVPLLGTVAAGQPIEAILTQERVWIPREMITGPKTFALKVRGDSMIDAHIQDGDIIAVEPRQTAENGDVVIALLDGSEATVKVFRRDESGIELHPRNSTYEPIRITQPERLSIQGVVRGVLHYCSG